MDSMKDVARIAGVSIATVSRVLNDKEGTISISAETRERVLAVVDKINYKPNYAAQRLRSRELDHSIGIYIPWGWGLGGFSSFTGKLVESVSKSIRDMPYTVTLVFYYPGEISVHYEELRRVRAHRIDAMMIVGASPEDIAYLDSVYTNKTPPFVVVHRELQNGNFVTSKNRHGACDIVEKLINKGHRRIALISTPRHHNGKTDYIYECRYLGYADALEKNGISVDERLVRFTANYDEHSVQRIIGELRSLSDPPTAYFATRDSLVISTLKSLKSFSLRVPDDVAVVGFSDNAEISSFFDPTLTSVVVPIEEMGSIAISYLAELLQSETTLPPLRESITCSINTGESC